MGSHTCQCTSGYTGDNCDEDVDDCQLNPCVHGTCTVGVNSHTCQCIPGYTGDNCDEDVDDCQPNPCVHGTCTDGVNSHTCQCTPGYTGDNCDDEELLNQGQECWEECNEIGGNCTWCGDLGSCCKLGRKWKMENGKWKMENGCTGSNGCQNKHCCTKSGLRHELLNQGQECWEECNEIGGNCTWCGDLGSCCKLG